MWETRRARHRGASLIERGSADWLASIARVFATLTAVPPDELDRALRFMHACGLDVESNPALREVDVYTSRSLDYLSWRNVLPRREMLNGVRVQRFTSFPRTRLVWQMLSFGLSNYQTTCSSIYEPFIFLGNGEVNQKTANSHHHKALPLECQQASSQVAQINTIHG